MQKTILFDINETVLDLSALKPQFTLLFGDEKYTATWFSMLLHSSTVAMITGVNTNFATLSKIALETLAAKLNIELNDIQVKHVLQGFASLKAHDDIKPALKLLRVAGFNTVALSNSSINLVTQQIENSGLAPYFDEIISVEEAATFKPHSTAYLHACKRLSCAPSDLLLVATHDWDTHGAMCAGLEAAYIQRRGNLYNPLYKQPFAYESSMVEVANRIIEKFTYTNPQ